MNYITSQFSRVVYIGKHNLKAFYKVQHTVHDTLKEQQTAHQFRLRSMKELGSHLSSGMPMLAVYHDGNIVGTALIIFPDKYKDKKVKDKALKGYPLSRLDPKKIIVIQGLSVLPQMRGKGVMRQLFHEVARIGIAQGRYDMIAKVHADNAESISMFTRYGFETYKIGKDPVFGTDVHYMQGDVIALWHRLDENYTTQRTKKPGLLRTYSRNII